MFVQNTLRTGKLYRRHRSQESPGDPHSIQQQAYDLGLFDPPCDNFDGNWMNF